MYIIVNVYIYYNNKKICSSLNFTIPKRYKSLTIQSNSNVHFRFILINEILFECIILQGMELGAHEAKGVPLVLHIGAKKCN